MSLVLTTPSFSRCGSVVEVWKKRPISLPPHHYAYIKRGVVAVWDVAEIRCGGFKVWKSERVGAGYHG